MIDINYKIEKVKPKIFAVIIEDSYDRAMTFLRIQEFYESPNPAFRGNKDFSFSEYMKWYTNEYGKGFTYGSDWNGFNVPLVTAYTCYDTLTDRYTDYDDVMETIIHKLYELNGDDADGYIIGVGNTEGDTFKHEVCHGLYYINPNYKATADAVTALIHNENYNIFEKNLLEMGYTESVIKDEIQAYLQYGWESNDFGKGVSLEMREMYNSWYEEELEEYLK
jgi:hypothetical protein